MVWLRPLALRDIAFCYRLAGDPVARGFSHDPNLPEWRRHTRRYWRNLRNPNMREWVVLRDGRRVGVLSVQLNTAATVSINLTEDARGMGLGATLTHWAARWAAKNWSTQVLAEIQAGNAASLKTFTNAGYTELGRTDETITMIWRAA